jgi:hypothetical protein
MSTPSLMKEYLELQKASFGIFGANAKRAANEIVDELLSRGVTEIPNIFGPIQLRKFEL